MLGILTFIIVFGILVIVHEFGHLYFAKKSGILVREFFYRNGPKIFRILIKRVPLIQFVSYLWVAMYAWLVGWMIRRKSRLERLPVLTLNQDGLVTRINLSQKQLDNTALPMNVTAYD